MYNLCTIETFHCSRTISLISFYFHSCFIVFKFCMKKKFKWDDLFHKIKHTKNKWMRNVRSFGLLWWELSLSKLFCSMNLAKNNFEPTGLVAKNNSRKDHIIKVLILKFLSFICIVLFVYKGTRNVYTRNGTLHLPQAQKYYNSEACVHKTTFIRFKKFFVV